MIAIIDYGLGNLGSILNMLNKLGIEAVVTSDHAVIQNASKLILPGVGAFDNGMSNLRERGLIDLLNKKVLEEKAPILGICLGMQLLTRKSEEGDLPGLDWIDAETVKFTSSQQHKVPNMGWSYVHAAKESALLKDMYDEPRFYFVHSYYVKCNDEKDVLLRSDYGVNYVSGVEKGNILGMQFHPEKSHKFGMKLLENFAANY
jgi:glutamine amidotransferase